MTEEERLHRFVNVLPEAEAFLRGRYGDRVTRSARPEDAKAAEAAGAGRPL